MVKLLSLFAIAGFLIPRVTLGQHPADPGLLHQQTFPKPGTMFVNTYFVTDSLGKVVPTSVVDPEMSDDTQIVFRTNISSHGRQECMILSGPQHLDSNIYSFAKNGDVYLLNTNHGEKWDHLPFSLKPGKVQKTEPVLDTGTALGHHYEMMDHREFFVDGHDTASANGKVYDCVKLRMIEVKIFEGVEYKNATTYWYAPELSYFIRANFGWGEKYFLNQKVAVYRPPQS